MEKHTTKLNYLRGNIEKLHQDIKIKMAEYLEIWHLCKKSYLCRKQHVLIQDWKFYLCFVSSVWAKAEFIVHQMSKHILRNEKSQISKSHQLKSIVSSDGTIIYQNSTKHSYSPMTVFIILTLKIQLSVIIRCRLAQLNMDLQKATCLRTIQNLEFTIPKKTSKAGSVDGQPCKYSSLVERPPWLPLYWSPTFSQPQLPFWLKPSVVVLLLSEHCWKNGDFAPSPINWKQSLSEITIHGIILMARGCFRAYITLYHSLLS